MCSGSLTLCPFFLDQNTLDNRDAGFITRQHAGRPCDVVTPQRPLGRLETG
jgi:hypothetical protein